VLDGGAGSDRLVDEDEPSEFDSPDVLNGGSGTDAADYSFQWNNHSPMTLTLDGVANDGHVGEKDNIGPTGDVENLLGGEGSDLLRGNGTANTLNGGGGHDELRGGDGDDVLEGSYHDDALYGEGGGDTLRGGFDPFGSDSVNGGPGEDVADYTNRDQALTIDLNGLADDGTADYGEHDNVAPDVEVVLAGSGPDVLIGSAGDETLEGGAGNDGVSGRLGDDVLDGGAGDDVLVEEGDVDLLLDEQTLAGVGFDDHAGFERARLSGGNDDNLLDTTAFSGPVVLAGGAGDDLLFAGPAADTVQGGDGNDLLDGGAGGDDVVGGGDVDTVDYSIRQAPVAVDIDDQPGDDGAPGEHDTVGRTNEILIGGSAGDSLKGDGSGNVLFGGAGADELDGGPGNDIVGGGSGADRLFGGAQFDTADYSERSAGVAVDLDDEAADDGEPGEGDTLVAMEDVRGGSGDDRLTGNAGENFLFGLGGNDTIDGGANADLLVGGSGDDRLLSRDGELDQDDCGDGPADTAVADWLDVLDACESADRPRPSANTGAASEITPTSARLAGTVSPNGNATKAYLDLGTTTAYGTKSPETAHDANVATATLSVLVSGLSPGTTYHYRIAAANGAGITYGADQTFTTLQETQAPPVDPPRPPPRRCVVPNVIGKTLSVTRRAIAKGRCRVGKITRRPSRVVPRGRVLAQKPKAGRRRPVGTRVNLTVSSGRRR
jgi:Ca2+-binding RTX toxin-like protein